MAWTENKGNNITLADVKDNLNEVYPVERIDAHLCYVNKFGIFFKAFSLNDNEKSFGIEYALNRQEVQQNRFEDGDLFYPDDYSSLDEMIANMCFEIDEAR